MSGLFTAMTMGWWGPGFVTGRGLGVADGGHF